MRSAVRLSLLLFWGSLAGPVAAQEFPTNNGIGILIVSQERLFSGSLLGQHILELEQVEQAAMVEEGRVIGEAFKIEELELTELRDTLSHDEFRVLADAFNEKVEATRTIQDQNDRAQIQHSEVRRRQFFQIAAPVLGDVMRRYGAVAVFDQRSVLLFDTSLDITRETIEKLNGLFAENPDILDAQ